MEYRIFYDYCDEDGNEEKDCQESFIGSWTELQNEIKEMKKNGCYNIDATAISEEEMDEDINDEMLKKAMRFTKNTQLSTAAWQNSGAEGCFSADGGSGVACCEEFDEDDLTEASAAELVKQVKKPAKKRGMTTKCSNTNMGANIAHFNHVSTNQPVDTGAIAGSMGIGVGLAGGGEGGDGGCCGGESLESTNKKSLNEDDADRTKIQQLTKALTARLQNNNWKSIIVKSTYDNTKLKVQPIGLNITKLEDCKGFKLFDVTDGKNELLSRNLQTIDRVAKEIILFRKTSNGKKDSFEETFKLRGITFLSADGQNRQENIAKLKVGDNLKLVSCHSSGNNAEGTTQDSMEVKNEDGTLSIGMIPSEYASVVSNNYHRHIPYELTVSKIVKPFTLKDGSMSNYSIEVNLKFIPKEKEILNDSLNGKYYYELYNGNTFLGFSDPFFDKESCKEAAEAEIKCCKEDGISDCDDLNYLIRTTDRFNPIKEEVIQEAYNPELEDLCDDLNIYLAENHCFEECWVDGDTIQCEIVWGDWKHDHLKFKWLATECLNNNGYEADFDENVTEEDGSDTYSAIHIIKNIKKLHLEPVEEVTDITGTLRENLERLDAANCNKYDLVQFYDSLSMTMDNTKKKKLYDLLYGEDAAKNIYEILSKDFEEVI